MLSSLVPSIADLQNIRIGCIADQALLHFNINLVDTYRTKKTPTNFYRLFALSPLPMGHGFTFPTFRFVSV